MGSPETGSSVCRVHAKKNKKQISIKLRKLYGNKLDLMTVWMQKFPTSNIEWDIASNRDENYER
jgi:hypothetical protein